MDFLKEMVKASGNPMAGVVDDGVYTDDCGYIDTGSYILNAQLSGSIFGGLPDNNISAFAGESATGKTFFTMGIVKNYLDQNPDAVVFFLESEGAVNKKMMQDRGIDTKRVVIQPVSTIQEFRTQAVKMLEKYVELPKDEKKPMMFVLDSLGMLSTTKEMEDTAEGKETKDMTRTSLIRSAFRVLTLKCAVAGVPILLTNHTYANVGGYGDPTTISGGGGLKYSASTIITLSKAKHKVGTEVVGNVIHSKMFKGRLTKENSVVDVVLTYDKGLDRYYGLLELGEKYKIFVKSGGRYEIDGKKVYGKTILENPETYFTDDILKKLDEAAKKEFLYGNNSFIEEGLENDD